MFIIKTRIAVKCQFGCIFQYKLISAGFSMDQFGLNISDLKCMMYFMAF